MAVVEEAAGPGKEMRGQWEGGGQAGICFAKVQHCVLFQQNVLHELHCIQAWFVVIFFPVRSLVRDHL